MTFPRGVIYLPEETAAYVLQRRADGIPCDVGQLGVDGAWQRLVERGVYGVFAGEVERELRGEESPVRSQSRGTCCSQGTAGACQDSITYAVAVHDAVGPKDIDIAAEPIYAIGRAVTGRGHYGRSDGLAGVHAAMAVDRYGVLRRGVYGGVDFSGPRESVGVDWGYSGQIPQDVYNALKPVNASNKVETDRELADTLASGYFSAICSTWQFADRRDENGMCSYKGPTAHCEQTSGVFLLPGWDGNPATCYQHTGVVRRQSWSGIPTGPDVLRYHGGTYKLRRGEYGITLRDAYRALQTMECWAFSAPAELWREAA